MWWWGALRPSSCFSNKTPVCACVCVEEEIRPGGLDLQEEEDHVSPQVIITSSSSLTLIRSSWPASARLAITWARTHSERGQETGSGTCRIRLRAPDMLGAVKMEGHEAPDWSGYYSEEVGHTLPALPPPSAAPGSAQTRSDRSGSGPEKFRFEQKILYGKSWARFWVFWAQR